MDKNLILSEIKIDKSSPEPIHLQLYKSLKSTIIKHRLEAGFNLPSELKIATVFELNRNTVRRACKTLEENGIALRRSKSCGLCVSRKAKKFYCPSHPAIGIILGCSFSDFVSVGNKNSMKYLSGVIDRASQLNHSTMIINLPPLNTSRQKVIEWRDDLVSRLVGIIYFGDRGVKGDFAFEALAGYKQLPQVFITGYSTQFKNISRVIADSRSGGIAAAEYLRESGHQRVGMIIPEMKQSHFDFTYTAFSRHKIMKDCFMQCGLELRDEWIAHGFSDATGLERQLDHILTLAEAPTAFWCYNDFTALHAIEYFKARNIRVPEDISLVGYDDIDEAASCSPSLSTIRHGNYSMGRGAVELLVDLFDNGEVGESREIKFPTSFSCRQSIGKVKQKISESGK